MLLPQLFGYLLPTSFASSVLLPIIYNKETKPWFKIILHSFSMNNQVINDQQIHIVRLNFKLWRNEFILIEKKLHAKKCLFVLSDAYKKHLINLIKIATS